MNLVQTECNDKIIAYLKQRPLVNQNILGALQNVDELNIYVDDPGNPQGVYAYRGYMRYLYTESDDFLQAVIRKLEEKEDFYGFSGIHEPLAKKLMDHFGFHWKNKCSIWSMEEEIDLSQINHQPQSLQPQHAEWINKHYEYAGEGSVDRIRKDIEDRPSSAIIIDGLPVCWVLIHEDNSMGIMYTLEDHRRKGYAVDVTLDLCRKVRERGNIPYVQIVEGNSKSEGLARKTGFVQKDWCYWFGIIVGFPDPLWELSEAARKELDTCPWDSKPLHPHYMINQPLDQVDSQYKVTHGQEGMSIFGASGFVEMDLLKKIAADNWDVWVATENHEIRAVAITKDMGDHDHVFEAITPVIPGRTAPWQALLKSLGEADGDALFGFGDRLQHLGFLPYPKDRKIASM